MEKANQAVIRMERIDDHCDGTIYGTYADVCNTILSVFLHYAGKDKQGRQMLRKDARIYLRETSIFRGVFDYWRGHVIMSIFGAACIYGALRGVGAVLHLLGVC